MMKIPITKLIFSLSVGGLLFVLVFMSTPLHEKYTKFHINHHFKVVDKKCFNVASEGEIKNKCYLYSSNTHKVWVNDDVYKNNSIGDVVSLGEDRLSLWIESTISILFAICVASLGCLLFCRFVMEKW